MQCGYQGQEMKPVVSWGTEVGPVSLFVRLSYQRCLLTMGFGPKDHHRQLVSWSQFLLRNTVSQANDKLIHCSTVSLCQLERCSIQRDRLVGWPTLLFHQRASEVSEYYGETSDVCKEGVGSSLIHHLSLKRPMTNLAPTVGGRYLCLPLPTTIITGHIHSQKGSLHKN